MFKHQCEAHRTRSAVEAQRGFPLRPNHLQRFLHQKLHSNLTKMFRDLHCEDHRTRSAVEVQHGSSPQAFNAKPTGPDQPLRFSMVFRFRPYHPQRFVHQKLHANRTKVFRHLHCEAHRTRSAVAVQHGSSPQAFNAKPAGPDQPLRFSMVFPLRPYRLQLPLRPSMRSSPDQMGR